MSEEYNIGDSVIYRTVKLKVVEDVKMSCEDCYFYKIWKCDAFNMQMSQVIGLCSSFDRKDKKYINYVMSEIEIHNGDIIRFNNDTSRDWVAIHYSNCDAENITRFNKNVKDNTGFYLFGGLWYDGGANTSKPYGKSNGQLKRGMFGNIIIVGNINNKQDYEKYIKDERL